MLALDNFHGLFHSLRTDHTREAIFHSLAQKLESGKKNRSSQEGKLYPEARI